jgi:shikimate dehydrogenase
MIPSLDLPLHLGLTGWPLGHSLSPNIHTTALYLAGLDGEYELFPIPPVPEGAAALSTLVARVRKGHALGQDKLTPSLPGLHGLNITIPHKQSVLSWLDKLTPTAAAIGAVNTLFVERGKLVGDNTDAPGFMADLERMLPESLISARALVLGAGGSARAVVYALAQAGWRVLVAARRPEQAEMLAMVIRPHIQNLNGEISTCTLESLSDCRAETLGLVVNCTPVGMFPQVDATPWPEGVPLPPRALVYDLVYNPPETKLMQAARAAGLTACNGLGLLVEQAVLSFERWTGIKPPKEALRQAALASQG